MPPLEADALNRLIAALKVEQGPRQPDGTALYRVPLPKGWEMANPAAFTDTFSRRRRAPLRFVGILLERDRTLLEFRGGQPRCSKCLGQGGYAGALLRELKVSAHKLFFLSPIS